MQRCTTLLLAATALAAAGAASSADVEVMTQNQYVGTDLIALVTEPDFNAAVVDALQNRAESRPAERAKALAALIASRKPALVGLQEVYGFTCLEYPAVADGKGCDNPTIAGAFTDQLADTLAALGDDYVEAATVVDLDLPDGLTLPDGSPLPLPQPLPGIPITIDDMTVYLGVIDRDVILARKDVPYSVVPYNAICPLPAGDGCNYQTVASAELAVNVPGVGPVPVLVKFQRGFVGVDATAGRLALVRLRRTRTYENAARSFRRAGALTSSQRRPPSLLQFMLAGPAAGARPQDCLLVGDMNSDPRDEVFPTVPPGYPSIVAVPPYQQYTALASFTDIWTKRPGAATGKGAPLVGFSSLPGRRPAQSEVGPVRAGRPDSRSHRQGKSRRHGCSASPSRTRRRRSASACGRRTMRPSRHACSTDRNLVESRASRVIAGRPFPFPSHSLSRLRGHGRTHQGSLHRAIVGLAVGDALGTTLEFRRPGSFTPIDDMVGGGPFNLEPGFWTDDTSMALCLADSLAEVRLIRRDRPDAALPALVQRRPLVDRTGSCFDIGNTTRAGPLRPSQRTGDPCVRIDQSTQSRQRFADATGAGARVFPGRPGASDRIRRGKLAHHPRCADRS